jgi:hypothetical protein
MYYPIRVYKPQLLLDEKQVGMYKDNEEFVDI